MAVVITATEQDVYPPRILVSVTGLTLGDSIAIYRVLSSQRTLVRAATNSAVTTTAFLVVDAELPFGVPIGYIAVVNGSTEYATSLVSHVLDNGKPVLTDAISGAAAEAMIVADPERARSRENSVFNVAGRTVVVSGPRGMYRSSIELFLESATSVDNFNALLNTATEGIVQIRNASGRSDYVAVLSDTETRYSQDVTDERRFYTIDVAEVEGWAAALEALGFTYQDVEDYYGVTGTYTDVENEFATYLLLAQGDFS